jgi:hypothetical protein
MGHSILPPSSAHIWGKPDGCTGWVQMSQTYPDDEESQASREGTAAHEIGAQLITDAKTNRVQNHSASDWVGITASNGVLFTEEMFDSAKEYADDVITVMRKTGIFGGEHLRIEQRVEIPKVHEINWGTPDCSVYHAAGNALYLWDYKHGFEVVEAFENWQGIDYLAGLLDLHGIDGRTDQRTKVYLRIAQPRAFHREGTIREWVITASDLRAYFNTLNANAHEALSPNAKFRTGSHCKHCTGRQACPAALKAGLGMYEAVSKPVPVELSPDALGLQLSIVKRARKQLEYLESGFETQASALIKKGTMVPGWSVEQKIGRQKWDKPVEEVIALGDMLNLDLRKAPDAITPIQAKKLGIDDAVIMAYSTHPRTGLEIVPDNGNKAKQVFKK